MLHVLSLGAGVQSSALALALANRDIDAPVPDAAIHADTQSDPPSVYAMVDWLAANLPYPVHVVTAGSVKQNLRDGLNSSRTKHYTEPPVFIRQPDGTKSMGRQQCTTQAKIIPIERELRRLLGLRKGARWPTTTAVTQYIGISTDEWARMKPSKRPAIKHCWPLIDAGWSRQDCVDYWHATAPVSAPAVGRSSCTVCPYRSTAEWRELKHDHSDLFAEACDIDAAIRHYIDGGELYLHSSLIPLADAIERDEAQGDLFGSECAGMCGV